MKLDPYQIEGATFLHYAPGKGALLADEPGLGKTRQAIKAAVAYAHAHPEVDADIAIVCPSSAIGVWRKELRELFDPLPPWIHIVSFEKAISLRVRTYSVLIIDEAHYAKTPTSIRTKILFGERTDGVGGLVERASRVILLSGTPTPNDASEMWAMCRAVFPDVLMWQPKDGPRRPRTFTQFRDRYCKVRRDGLGNVKIVGGRNIPELRALLKPHVLRRLKKDVLKDLPAVRFSTLPLTGRIDYAPDQAEDVAALGRILAAQGVDGLNDAEDHVASLRRVTGLAKVDPVSDWIEDWFASGGGKLVVFAYHKDVIAGLEKRFSRAGYTFVVVDGGTTSSWRAYAETKFQSDPHCDIFLGQNKAAGISITLTAASTLLLVEPEWTPGNNDQIWQRIHRYGQKNACDVRFPTIAGSLDNDITRATVRKMETINALWNENACA